MFRSILQMFTVLCLVLAVLSGCGGQESGSALGTSDDAKEKPAAFDPNQSVSLKLGQLGASLTDEEFQKLIVEPVKKVYPNVSLELVRLTGASIPDKLSAGEFPDFTFMSSRDIAVMKQYSAVDDVQPYLKKNNIDLSKFDPIFEQVVKGYSGDGKMFDLPLWAPVNALYYNKDIFDKFGVSYPKDNMTWDEVLDLAAKLSRTDQGVNYIGVYSGIANFKQGLGLGYVDPKTKKGLFETPEWQMLFGMYDKMEKIPGNYAHGKSVVNLFEKDRVMAMLPNFIGRLGEFEQLYKDGNPLNFDIATYPSFQETKNYNGEADAGGMSIYVNSNKKDWAFRVTEVLLRKENQLAAVRTGRASVLKDTDLQKEFGANLNSLKGKHIEGFFTKPFHLPEVVTEYDDLAKKRMNEAITKVVEGKTDINSALREADELLNQDIAAAGK